MNKNDFILKLYGVPQTVFSTKEIALMFVDVSYENIKARLNYYVKTGRLLSLSRGLYAKKDFNKYELATKIYTPSYISLETVLAEAGVVFQTYETVMVISYVDREVSFENNLKIKYKRISEKVLSNKAGVSEKDNYFVASIERAFLDILYLYKDYHFDNLFPINWERVFEIAPIYKSKILLKRLESYYKLAKDNV